MLTFIVGAPRTGKTTLGRKLAAERGARLISTDDFLHLPHDRQLDAIRATIEVQSNPRIIVEGVTAARLLPHRPDGRAHVGPVPDEVFWVRGPSEDEPRYRGLASWVTRFVESYAAKAPVTSMRMDAPDPPERIWLAKTRTRQTIRLARAVGLTHRRRGRIPRQQSPLAIEASFGRALVEILRGLATELAPLREAMPRLFDGVETAKRVDAGERETVSAIMEAIRERMRARMRPEGIRGVASRAAVATTEFQKQQFRRQMRAGLGVDIIANDAGVAGAIEDFVAEGTALIRHLPEKLVNDVERAVFDAFARGETYAETAKKIDALLVVGEERAYHIAGQQVAQLNAKVTELRQRNIGIDSYVWRTANDEKVRPAHRAREGKRYSWGNPPNGETPGNAPGWYPCRCYPEPVFDALLGDE